MKPITVSENLERDKKKALSPMPLSDFLSRLIVAVPELKFRDKVNNHLSISLKGETVELQFAALDKAIDSSSITPNDWQMIASIIQQQYHDFDGFVILHGTDTMAYSASALSFIFQSLSKPIIFTGSQLPIDADHTDAIDNLLGAIHTASYKVLTIPLIAEVVIVFGGQILRANRSTKVHTSAVKGFSSPSFPVLGYVDNTYTITINEALLVPKPEIKSSLPVNVNFDNSVNFIYLFPGINDEIIKLQFADTESKAIVIASYGMGNLPVNEVLYGALIEASKQGKLLLNISQCISGKVNMGTYAINSKLIEMGVISGSDLTIEAAITKMMWLLGSVPKYQQKAILSKSIRGEQST